MAIVDQQLAASFWPNQSPLGRAISVAGGVLRTVVGVVPSLRLGGEADTAPGQVYVLNSRPVQSAFLLAFVVRVRTADSETILGIKTAVEGIDPSIRIYSLRTGQQLVDGPIVPRAVSTPVRQPEFAFTVAPPRAREGDRAIGREPRWT